MSQPCHAASPIRRIAIAIAIAAVIATIGVVAAPAAAAVQLPQYAPRGKANSVNYRFTAARTGTITAWFTGSTASYVETLGLMINGVGTGITGLNNKTSAYGDKLILGNAKAGDKLVFFIDVLTIKKTFYSDTSRNFDGVNHVFSASYAGDARVPAGTYIGFEDMTNGGDFNYFDESFVFSNVASRTVRAPGIGGAGDIPEPASWALLIAGFGLTGAAMRRRRMSSLAANTTG